MVSFACREGGHFPLPTSHFPVHSPCSCLFGCTFLFKASIFLLRHHILGVGRRGAIVN
nr:hypothetical protein Iba_chr10eCG13940 [Ipomoea batatas]